MEEIVYNSIGGLEEQKKLVLGVDVGARRGERGVCVCVGEC